MTLMAFENTTSSVVVIVLATTIALLLATLIIPFRSPHDDDRVADSHDEEEYELEDEGVEACRRLRADPRDPEEEQKAKGKSSWWAWWSNWRVKSLWIYPVKSCKGIELSRSAVTGLGLQYDRQFSFAHFTSLQKKKEDPPRSGWKFLTQRQVPALATVKTEMWVPDPYSPTYNPQHANVISGGVVVIKWPATESYMRMNETQDSTRRVLIPFKPTLEQIQENGYKSSDMDIWSEAASVLQIAGTEGSQAGSPSNTWIHDLLEYLGEESRKQNPPRPSKDGKDTIPGFSFDLTKPFALFRIASQKPRSVFRNAPTQRQLGYQPTVGLQDSYPLHIMNVASVRDVARRLEPGSPPISFKNYRPNIVIEGGRAYAEDKWLRASIGGEMYHVVCRTARCLLPNVNQATGKRAADEPNKTMKSFRKIDEGCSNSACLGMQMVPAVNEEREIKVGDKLEVLEMGGHFYKGR